MWPGLPLTLLENRVAHPPDQNIKSTPLDSLHRELDAKMVPFAGYAMPVNFQGIIAEHQHTRENAGLFDVSHMGQAIIRGADAARALETLVPSDIAELGVGRTRYTVFTNEAGGILDDLMVTNRGDHLFVVVNAACKDQDFAHMRERLGGDAELEVIEDRALLALQGPKAADVLARLAPPCRHMMFMTAETLTIADVPSFVTRSGYTGEDGYEISVAADKAEHLARLLLAEDEVAAIGLGARDSLRLEAGLCLYGSDIDTTTTPIEASLAWTISRRRRDEGGFPGADVILRQIAEGVERKRVGLTPEGKVPARSHAQVTDAAGTVIGEVTSGGFGPTVGAPVAMGYIAIDHAKAGTPVQFLVRGKAHPGRVAKLPFVEHQYFKK